MRIAFLGLGQMGRRLARHLVAAGHDVTVWNRTLSATRPLVQAGATAAKDPASAVTGRDVVVSMLFGPDQVREVVTHAELPFETGSLWIDATTVSPPDADEFSDWAARRNVRFVHAPVTGSTPLAEAGRLGVLLGGDALDEAVEIVRAWGDPERILRFESAGQAAAAKLVANIGVAVSFQGLVEALRMGRAMRLNLEQVLDILSGGPLMGTVAAKAEILRSQSFDVQFSAQLLAKDITLMVKTPGVELPALAAVLAELNEVIQRGEGQLDFSVVARPDL